MGARPFTNRQAHEYLDSVVCSDRDKRVLVQAVDVDDQRWSGMANDQYGSTIQRLSRDLDSVIGICKTAEVETVPSIVEDLRNGDIDATEAARLLGAARRDLNKMRRIAEVAESTEAQAWEAVDCSP